jgi:Tol biopolymer transport system component
VPSISGVTFVADGKSLVYSARKGSNCFLYRRDLTSGETERVTKAENGCETEPAFSVDGKMFAFVRSPSAAKKGAIILSTVDGQEKELVSAENDNLSPQFVAGSDTIIFLRSGAFEHYSPIVGNRRHKFDLFAVSSTNRKVVQLTNQRFYEITKLSVAPNGRRVVFSTTAYPQGDLFRILPVNDAKEAARDLQPRVPNAPTGEPVIYDATWLSDSESMVFKAASLKPPSSNFDYNIYLLSKNGEIEKLTDVTGLMDDLAVSPDSSKIVFLKDGAVYLLDLRSKQTTKLAITTD